MPLVFAENEETESGITYEDRTGISYQYPRAYRRIISPGERFIYYRGRRKKGGGRLPQVYFGTGVVGNISTDRNRGDRYVCEILDHAPFAAPVPFKKPNGEYFETGAERRGYFQRGVRVISDADFQHILETAQATLEANLTAQNLQPEAVIAPVGSITYASVAVARAIEEFAVEAALTEIRKRYADCSAKSQPRNNPGFDVLVHGPGGHIYAEVKGTTRPFPQFFVTEGELQFSRRHAEKYRLIVIFRINVVAGTYEVFWHEGAISTENGFRLNPLQWTCEVRRTPEQE